MSDIVEIMADGAYRAHQWSSFWSRDDAKELMRAAIAALEAKGYSVVKKTEDIMVSAAVESARLANACRDDPTKLNLVLHAVSVWRQGCVHGGPGDCPECDALFLSVIAKHLGGST